MKWILKGQSSNMAIQDFVSCSTFSIVSYLGVVLRSMIGVEQSSFLFLFQQNPHRDPYVFTKSLRDEC